MTTRVVVLDYGSGNVHSVVRMLERIGAEVELTADRDAVLAADGLYVPGVGNFHACMTGLRAVGGDELVRTRLAGGRPVLGVCVGHQVLFEGSAEPSVGGAVPGIGCWTGSVVRLEASVVPHVGWTTVRVPIGSVLFAGVERERFYFVHSYAARDLPAARWRDGAAPLVSTAEHGREFVAAVEDGALRGTQFHPEKSGDAGATLLENWRKSL
ncbi:imidazole glycerol phosphate synthase subunit HisH [Leekyejoonella antrihumi]|uniref:Imidazole glycerol phosphate synthase subunit HisH n=1 Tax=Leekyejoonella antrihumi TaxID=1660198 RepID=A0A563DSM0_9MICO|nr:imidazole glycerol phosphate synthase subunit HisH [Leekyejoonella antrihumi]TWP32932.1 imidazole glycerol phosphate synthase subunit HisH [Leekyejoonella antrihumi]